MAKRRPHLPKRRSLLRELFDFVWQNKLWAIAPVIAALLLLGILVILGSSKAAPFIYTLF
jgi:hypothetical protein